MRQLARSLQPLWPSGQMRATLTQSAKVIKCAVWLRYEEPSCSSSALSGRYGPVRSSSSAVANPATVGDGTVVRGAMLRAAEESTRATRGLGYHELQLFLRACGRLWVEREGGRRTRPGLKATCSEGLWKARSAGGERTEYDRN